MTGDKLALFDSLFGRSQGRWFRDRVPVPIITHRRKRYYCTKCEKFHGKKALKKWAAHRQYAGEPHGEIQAS